MEDKRGEENKSFLFLQLGMFGPKTGPGDHNQSYHDSKRIQGHWFSLAALLPVLRWVVSYVFPYIFHCSGRLRFQLILLKKYLSCFCHGFLFLTFLLSRKRSCSPLTFLPIWRERIPAYWCRLQLWTQTECMSFGVVFITVLKAWQMSSAKTPAMLFLPPALNALQLLQHTRQGS